MYFLDTFMLNMVVRLASSAHVLKPIRAMLLTSLIVSRRGLQISNSLEQSWITGFDLYECGVNISV